MRAAWAAIAAVLLVVAPNALASPVTSTYCFEQNTAFTDASVGDHLTGSSTVLRGTRVQFVRESDSFVVDDVFTNDGSGSGGCVTLDGLNGTTKLDANSLVAKYTVKVLREALVDGQTILVRNSSGGTYTSIPKTGFNPTANHTYSYANGDTWTRLASSDQGMIMAAAQWTIHRQPAHLGTETFTFRNGVCNGVSGSCFDRSSEILWIGHPSRKFVIGQILGLAVGNFRNGHSDPQFDANTAALDGCVTGGTTAGVLINSKECTSAAAYEGFGLFYSAAAFNNDGADQDCDYESAVNVDWSADGDTFDPDEDNIFSCEGSPAPSQSPPINANDYVEQKCSPAGSTVDNRSVAYDWLRALWDYHTGETITGTHLGGSKTVADIYDLWNDANPDSWITCGPYAGGTTDYPYDRLFDASGGGFSGPFHLIMDWNRVDK